MRTSESGSHGCELSACRPQNCVLLFSILGRLRQGTVFQQLRILQLEEGKNYLLLHQNDLSSLWGQGFCGIFPNDRNFPDLVSFLVASLESMVHFVQFLLYVHS